MDGLTPISDAGMRDWFGDNLKLSNYLIGTYDQDKGHYNLTLQNNSLASFSSIPTIVSPLVSSSGTTARVAPGNTSGIAPGPVTGVSPGITSGVSSGTTSGVLQPTIISTTQLAGVTPGVTPVVTPATQQVESYTLSYSEQVKGWTSFKSFIPENGISCSNKYYTFYNANIFEHHLETSDRNTFYFGEYTPSSVTFIFNQEPSVVKEFRALTYEGSQARILSNYYERTFFSAGTQGALITTRTYSSYKNINNENGWYTENIKTDMEEGNIPYFVNKERKWFNYIRGNNIDYSTAAISGPSFKLDSSKFSIQGIGRPSDVKKIVTIVTPPPVVPCNITWLNTNYQTDWGVEVGYSDFSGQLEVDIEMFAATDGTIDAAGNQSFRYEVTYQIPTLMVNEVVLTNLTNNLNNNINMTSGSSNVKYQDSEIHNVANDFSAAGAFPGTYPVSINIRAYDLTHPDSTSCVTTASLQSIVPINTSIQAPCNITWHNTNFGDDWGVSVTYNNTTNELATLIKMYGATNGTLDSNGNESFVYEIVYAIINTTTGSPITNQGRHVLIDATNDVNNDSGMIDGTHTSRYDIESLHNVIDEVDSSNLPLAPGTYRVDYQFLAVDVNNPDGGCQVVADLNTTFTVAAPIVNQLLPGTLTLMQTNNGNPKAAVNASFTSASGGTPPYTYTNIQWRETDANGNIISGMSGTFTPINSLSSPNINNQFFYTWPFGNQTTAYVTVTYDITDSSVPQQTLTHEGTIAVTRPAPPPPPVN
jgi:hypothetical protein